MKYVEMTNRIGLTPDHKKRALEIAWKKHEGLPVTEKIRFSVRASINEYLNLLLYNGEIRDLPCVEVNSTVIGSTLNKNNEWVDVVDPCSVTVEFIDKRTGGSL